MRPTKIMHGEGTIISQDSKQADVTYNIREEYPESTITTMGATVSMPKHVKQHGHVTPISNEDRRVIQELMGKRGVTLNMASDNCRLNIIVFNQSKDSFEIKGDGPIIEDEE